MQMPEISVVVSVCNAEAYLLELLQSIQNQTMTNFEVICVDRGSTDRTMEILEEFILQDSRFSVMQHKQTGGVGSARNDGFQAVTGQYTIFLDEAAVCYPTLLEKLWKAAKQTQADAAVCNYIRIEKNGNSSCKAGITQGWLPTGTTAFCYEDCTHRILNIWNPEPWNKLYRSDFLREHHIKYEDISSQYNTTFAAVSAAAAKRIVYVAEHLVQYRVGQSRICTSKTEDLHNLPIAISSTIRQVKTLPHRSLIEVGICFFAIHGYLLAAKNWIEDFQTPAAEEFYTQAHNTFQDPFFDALNPGRLQNQELYWEFFTVRKHDYGKMRELIRGKRIVVSLTTFPGRIDSLSKVLDTIYAQTLPADRVVLWLAEDQFLKKEESLPQDLRRLVEQDRLEIRWCRDLKPHKKYFYALQEFTEDLVVTVDDDLLYPKDMLEKLYKSYLMYPEAVSTLRAHLILFDENNKLLPYSRWIKETDSCMYEPSMQLLATGGAGVLYPPKRFHPAFFDEEAVVNTCLWADDLWLKAMQAVSDVPVVVARQSEPLAYLPGSQDTALCHSNVDQNQNDVQLSQINKWLDRTFEVGILEKKLTAPGIGVQILGANAVIAHLDMERKSQRTALSIEKKRSTIEKQQLLEKQSLLQQQIQERQSLLQQQIQEKQDLLAAQELTKKQLLRKEQELQKGQELLKKELLEKERLLEQQHLVEQAYLQEQQQLTSQLNALEDTLNNPKELLDRLMQSWEGHPIHVLAWIPYRYLGFLQCIKDHGFFYTVRHAFSQVGRIIFGKKQKP